MKRERINKHFGLFGKKNKSSTAPQAEEFERCVMCGKLTCVPVSMPVDWRENYEMGMGQLCAECAKNSV